MGRSAYIGTPEEGDPILESDPQVERFRSLGEDNPVVRVSEEQAFSWISKVCGDQQKYKEGAEGTVQYAVNVVSSLRWPGAITVSKKGKYCSIYIGDGIKWGDSSINPSEPPNVCDDPA